MQAMQTEEDALMAAALRQGVQTCLHVSRSSDGVRGLFCDRPMPAGAILMTCPAHMQLTMPYSDSAFSAPWLLREVLHHRSNRKQQEQPHQQQLALQQQQQQQEQQQQQQQQQEQEQQPIQQQGQQEQQQSQCQGIAVGTSGSQGTQAVRGHPRCASCGARMWRPTLGPEFVASLPKPGELLTGYMWPEEAIPLLACPDLEAVVWLFKRRALRVFRTGLAGGMAAPDTCRGAQFPLSLAAAELQASGLCPACTPDPAHGHSTPASAPGQPAGAPAAAAAGPMAPPAEPSATAAAPVQESDSVPGGAGGTERVGGRPVDIGCGSPEQASSTGESVRGAAGSSVALGSVRHGVCVASLADVEWAASLVCSRTFSSSYQLEALEGGGMRHGTMVMVPLLDMVNHTDERMANACIHSSSESAETSEDEESDSEHQVEANGHQPSSPPPLGAVQPNGGNVQATTNGNAHALEGLQDRLAGLHLQPHGGHAHGQELHGRRRSRGGLGLAAPLAWASGYNRTNGIRSKRAMAKGDEVTFTYHLGLRDDEVLVYYGFLPAPVPLLHQGGLDGVPRLCAVDHPMFRPARVDPADGEVYDATGSQLVIDPLDGPWRQGKRPPFQGAVHQLQQELRRLTSRLEDHTQRCAALELDPRAPGVQEACNRAGMPWLPELAAEFRRRRAASLKAEITRLTTLLRPQPVPSPTPRHATAYVKHGKRR